MELTKKVDDASVDRDVTDRRAGAPIVFSTTSALKWHLGKLEQKYARSQRELADILEERDRYREKYNDVRIELVEAQTREESARCEIQDLRRQLRRYHEDAGVGNVPNDLNAAIHADGSNVLVKQDKDNEIVLHSPAITSRTTFKAISSALQTKPQPLIVPVSSLPRTPPPSQPPSAHSSPVEVKPSIRRRLYVEIPASPRCSTSSRDVSNGDLFGQRCKLKRTISIPSSRSTKRRHSPTAEKHILPKNKKDKSTFIPPQALVTSLISSIPLFTVDPPPHARCIVTRRLLLEKYSVASRAFLGYLKPSQTSSLSGRMVVLPQKRYNPALPSQPGAHGLLFSVRHHVVGQTVALFVKEGTQALWTYYGEYKDVLCGKVTGQVFMDQAEEVKQDWAQKILVQKSDEYLSVKARVSLRKDGQSINDSNVKNEMDRLKTMPKNVQNLKTRDVIDALVRGDEGLEIIRLECVGFDHSLVEDIRREGLFRKAFEGPLPELTESESEDDRIISVEA
ncbi:uncharacterized protein EV420DRAFT_1633823 [Desarmillaria tabescens]|uniref:DUF6697 domain-containing protein n=1 Tax=Armillaria tabescens TaxID=1929756 RepID=A0AA39NPG3_ARMTA|nr:uncharacterized protein EV420DRAFT_1633823 [Desarmillaria tabescens]KAK0469411.1 hypothetical protein EV420DRAFT_1633823 [Desarmillaria tabescens]